MAEALATIQQLRVRYRNIGVDAKNRKFNLDLLRTIELGGMLEAAETMAAGALARQESRGAHSRMDFKTRDDVNWIKHTLAFRTADGPRLEYSSGENQVGAGGTKILESVNRGQRSRVFLIT